MKKLLTLLGLTATLSSAALAQTDQNTKPATKSGNFYTSSSLDGAIFSLNVASTPGVSHVLRFTYFINTGLNFNYDFNKHVGIYTGINIKNLGFIDRYKGANPSLPDVSYTVKRRVYAAGLPLGLKLGNLSDKGTFFILGGGVDFPVNYKVKTFTDGRKNKTKRSEWFSDEVTPVMPYVFAGVSFRSHVSLKLQYYPQNFMKDDALNYDTHVAMASVSFYVKNKNHGQTRKAFRMMFKNRKEKEGNK